MTPPRGPHDRGEVPEGPPTSPLQIPAFRALWLAATVSFVGSFVQEIAERWIILELTHSPLPSAMMMTAFVLASLFGMLPAGVLADRYDRRLLIAISQVVQAAAAIALAGMVWTGHVTPAVLLCGAAVLGFGMAMASPAWNAMLPELVSRSLVADAITLYAIAFNIARAIGPAIGGLVLSSLGATAAFALNAASFLVVLVVVMRFGPPKRPTGSIPPPIMVAFRDPFRLVVHGKALRGTFLAMCAFSLGASMVYALAPAYGKTTLGASAREYGVMIGAMGAGAIVGATMLKRLRSRTSPRVLVGAMILTFAACAIALAATHSVMIAILVFLPAGLGWTCAFSSLSALAQIWAPDRLRARIIALYGMVHLGTWAIGSTIGGMLASRFDVRIAMAAGALVCVAAGLATMAMTLPSSFIAESTDVDDILREGAVSSG